MALKLTDEVAVITGDSVGIAITEGLAAEGANLVLGARDAGRVETDIFDRTVTLSYLELAGRDIVAAVGGTDKVDTLQSILRRGLLKGLITDEATAAALVGRAEGAVFAVPQSRAPAEAANRSAKARVFASPRACRADSPRPVE